VYVICDDAGALLYIGSTADLQRRLKAHWRQYGFSLGRNVMYWYPLLSPFEATCFEYWLIGEHRPMMNTKGIGKRAASHAAWFRAERVIPA